MSQPRNTFRPQREYELSDLKINAKGRIAGPPLRRRLGRLKEEIIISLVRYWFGLTADSDLVRTAVHLTFFTVCGLLFWVAVWVIYALKHP